jgi:hypothetical protein
MRFLGYNPFGSLYFSLIEGDMRRIVIGVILTGVCFVSWNCADREQQPDNRVFCNIYLSRVRGQAFKHFSSQINFSSNFVVNGEYQIEGLPPGLAMNTSGLISGTPTASGFWHVKVRVRDREKGIDGSPVADNMWYYQTFEIKIFDKLTDEN